MKTTRKELINSIAKRIQGLITDEAELYLIKEGFSYTEASEIIYCNRIRHTNRVSTNVQAIADTIESTLNTSNKLNSRRLI